MITSSQTYELQKIIDALNETAIVAVTDHNGTIIYANKKFCEISKYAYEELIGKNHRILKSGFHSPEFYSQMWKTISCGKIWRGTIKNKAKDDSFYWVKTTIIPVFDENERPRQYVSIRVDVTDLIELHQRLKESVITISKHKQFANLYDNSPELFRTVSTTGTIIQCNETYAKSLGYTKNEVIGHTIFEHTAEQSIHTIKQAFEKWKQTGSVSNVEILLKRKDGSTFPVLLSANNLYDKDGRLIGSNSILRDISDLYKLKKEKEVKDGIIQKQLLKLQELSKQKDDFLAMITHELKTPLVPIKGYVDLILAGKYGQISEQQRRALSNIKTNIDLLTKLISSLLDAQKIEMGKFTVNRQPANISKTIQESVEDIAPDILQKNILLTTHIDDGLVCLCDKQRIKQVLCNILSNAVDFCTKENGKIEITAKKEQSHIHIVVKDNGIGIQKSKLKNLFQKFYQIDPSLTREHGGVGLGLSICMGIIKLHDGQIFAKSEGPGKGAEIHIRLPLM